MECLHLDAKDLRTESAIDGDEPIIIAHFGALSFREARQDRLVVFGRAAAPARKLRQLFDADFLFFMKQTPNQSFQ